MRLALSLQRSPYLYQNTYHMGIWRQVGEYLYIKKKDPERKATKSMKYMHGINRISILLFILAIIILIIKLIVKK